MRLWQLNWMPATVFLIGVFSIFLLLSSSWLSKKQHNSFLIEDALMDAQIRVASFHVRLEELLRGDVSGVGDADIWQKMEEAVSLVDATLNGGPAEHGQIIEPIKDQGLRDRAADIKSLLVEFRNIALELMKEPGWAGSGTPEEERFHAIYKAILAKASALESVLEEENIRNQIRQEQLFKSILIVWGIIVIGATAGLWNHEKRRKKAEEGLLKANYQLQTQTEELAQHRAHLTAEVERRTASLTAANELLQSEIIERLQAEKSLKESEQYIRKLSSQLLIAQETERRRISMELHDALGQALIGVKLQIRGIEKSLTDDQNEARDDCESLRTSLDQVIEDVRRLSLNLSPTVLQDLGLTSALQWLVSDFKKGLDMKVTSEMHEIDHLIPKEQWIVVYRVVQEALSNIIKHSHADNVAVIIGQDQRRDHNRVFFSIEDNGKGFDRERVEMRAASEKGLGLTTMNERVRMTGGVLDLWSRQGEGTRITFSVPVVEGEA